MNGSLCARISTVLLAGYAFVVLALPASAEQAVTSLADQAVTTQLTAATQDFLLGVGDMIEISVFENAAFFQEARIPEIAKTKYPLIGSFGVGGTSTSTLEKRIARTLVDGVPLPDLRARVLVDQTYESQVADIGRINCLGSYGLDFPKTKLSDLIVLSGDIAKREFDKVILIRLGNSKLVWQEIESRNTFVNRQPENNVHLQLSDVRFVVRFPQYDTDYICPKVQRAGSHRVERDRCFAQALPIGNGFTARDTQTGLSVKRDDSGGKVARLGPGIADPIMAEDMIFVRESMY